MRLTKLIIAGSLALSASAIPASDPAKASMCAAGTIPTEPASWLKYKVGETLHEIFKRAPNPKEVDIGSELRKATGSVQGLCVVKDTCPLAPCKLYSTQSLGDDSSVALWLANTAYVNFANFLSSWDAGLDKGVLDSIMASGITASTYFSFDVSGDVKLAQALGIASPFLGMLSGLLGPASGIASSSLGALSGMIGSVAGIYGAKPGTVDATFKSTSDLNNYVKGLYDGYKTALVQASNSMIGRATEESWLGKNVFLPGLMGNGFWLGRSFDTTVSANDQQENIGKAFKDVIFWKTINYAYNASNVFIIYVPYGFIKDNKGSYFTLSRDNCRDVCGEDKKCLCETDPKGGMARFFRAKDELYALGVNGDASPAGLTSEEVGGTWKYNNQDILQGSLNSWREGDFKYDIGDVTDLSKFKSSDKVVNDILLKGMQPTQPGIFNLPVCQIFDLRSWPGKSGLLGACACSLPSAGGGKDPKKLFKDNVSKAILKASAEYYGQDTQAPSKPKCSNLATSLQKFGDGTDDGQCGDKVMGDKGIFDKPIDKGAVQKCLRNLDTSKWLDRAIGQSSDCEHMVTFESASDSWNSPGDCHNACKNCLSQAIEDGASQAWCNAWSGRAHCWEGYTTKPATNVPGSPLIVPTIRAKSNTGMNGKPIDRWAAAQCVKDLDSSRWYDGDGNKYDCGGMLKFDLKNLSTWQSSKDCWGTIQRCLQQAIFDGASEAFCEAWAASAHCIGGFMPR